MTWTFWVWPILTALPIACCSIIWELSLSVFKVSNKIIWLASVRVKPETAFSDDNKAILIDWSNLNFLILPLTVWMEPFRNRCEIECSVKTVPTNFNKLSHWEKMIILLLLFSSISLS